MVRLYSSDVCCYFLTTIQNIKTIMVVVSIGVFDMDDLYHTKQANRRSMDHLYEEGKCLKILNFLK